MLCPVCHREIRETDHICPFCATPLTRYGTRMPALPETERLQAENARKKAHRRFLVLAGLGAGALGILGCMVLSAALGSMDFAGSAESSTESFDEAFLEEYDDTYAADYSIRSRDAYGSFYSNSGGYSLSLEEYMDGSELQFPTCTVTLELPAFTEGSVQYEPNTDTYTWAFSFTDGFRVELTDMPGTDAPLSAKKFELDSSDRLEGTEEQYFYTLSYEPLPTACICDLQEGRMITVQVLPTDESGIVNNRYIREATRFLHKHILSSTSISREYWTSLQDEYLPDEEDMPHSESQETPQDDPAPEAAEGEIQTAIRRENLFGFSGESVSV